MTEKISGPENKDSFREREVRGVGEGGRGGEGGVVSFDLIGGRPPVIFLTIIDTSQVRLFLRRCIVEDLTQVKHEKLRSVFSRILSNLIMRGRVFVGSQDPSAAT